MFQDMSMSVFLKRSATCFTPENWLTQSVVYDSESVFKKRVFKKIEPKKIINGFFNSISKISPAFYALLVILTVYSVYLGTLLPVSVLVDGKILHQVSTNSRTADELFTELGLVIKPDDLVKTTTEGFLQRNDIVEIERAFPVFISADHNVKEVRTIGVTVGKLLDAEGFELGRYDEVYPGLNEELAAYDEIKIVRIEKVYTAMNTTIPYESVTRENPSLERGVSRVISEGVEGVMKETFEIVYIDGEEVQRQIVEEELVEEPQKEVIEKGTKPVIPVIPASFEAAALNVNIGTGFTVNATAYCAGTPGTGCPVHNGRAHCTGRATGLTAIGMSAVAGSGTRSNPHIIAVDPSLIPLRSTVYIEGYGYAYAADTGGAIRGAKIDLLFATHQQAVNFGRRNLKIYLVE